MKKQEVMKPGLAQPYQARLPASEFHDASSHTLTPPLPPPTRLTPPPPPPRLPVRINTESKMDSDDRGAIMDPRRRLPPRRRNEKTPAEEKVTAQQHLRWMDTLRRSQSSAFSSKWLSAGVMEINHRHILSRGDGKIRAKFTV